MQPAPQECKGGWPQARQTWHDTEVTHSQGAARGEGRGIVAAKPCSFPDTDFPQTESEHGLRTNAI